MNLVRLGHLHTPRPTPRLFAMAGECSTALVVDVEPLGPDSKPSGEYEMVNLSVFDHEGVRTHGFTDILVRPPVDDPEDSTDEGHTFHLSGDCPWKR